MQKFIFLTRDDKGKFTRWCETNEEKMFFDFMQYIIDSCNKPEEFILYDVDNNAAYNMYEIATKRFGMRKRTSNERGKNIQTYSI